MPARQIYVSQKRKETFIEGRKLYEQGEYSEAEERFRNVVDMQERTLREDHEDELKSKQWLGQALYKQKKYSEAEKQFRQAADVSERILGRAHEDTLWSKHFLGQALYFQKKYTVAEEQFRQATNELERTLGRNHEETLKNKQWLGIALYCQQKYSEAEEQFRQATNELKRTLGEYHEDTRVSLRFLQKLQQSLSSLLTTNDATKKAITNRLNSIFTTRRDNHESYTDSEINEISSLLKDSHSRWSKVPRTYIVLRTIDQLNLLDDLIDVGFSDYYFPVSERNLPAFLSPTIKSRIVKAQHIVLTKSLDLEKGAKGKHCYFQLGESCQFLTRGILGRGAYGEVDKVYSLVSCKEYARKRIIRALVFRGRQKEDEKHLITEIEILKHLKHDHIVGFVGSYTDSKYMGLIMSPTAEMNLGTYLKHANDSKFPELRTFFGCLATALEFLHEKNIRHKDIKPSNILVHCGRVLLADFGLSLDFSNADGSTTISEVTRMTRRYCAPELILQQSRNSKSDIWSLGAVFMEMTVILKGKTAQYIEGFYEQHKSWQAFILSNNAALPELVAELEKLGESSDNVAFGWSQQMLSVKHELRPTASSLVEYITNISEVGGPAFCGICCVSSGESFDDWADE